MVTQETIDEFVVAAHHDFPFVQQKLAEQPELLNENATWIETPVQAAAHVGNRPIAEFLLAQAAPLGSPAAERSFAGFLAGIRLPGAPSS